MAHSWHKPCRRRCVPKGCRLKWKTSSTLCLSSLLQPTSTRPSGPPLEYEGDIHFVLRILGQTVVPSPSPSAITAITSERCALLSITFPATYSCPLLTEVVTHDSPFAPQTKLPAIPDAESWLLRAYSQMDSDTEIFLFSGLLLVRRGRRNSDSTWAMLQSSLFGHQVYQNWGT